MKDLEFTNEELTILCSLYLEGKLSKKEEKSLFLFLEMSDDLPIECKDTFNLMKIEKIVFSKSKEKKSRVWKFSSVAAAVLILVSLVSFFNIDTSTPNKEDTFIVWENGEQITGEEARKIAEKQQEEKMMMIREIMKKQRELMKRNFASADLNDADY